jgi:hypothetical protein
VLSQKSVAFLSMAKRLINVAMTQKDYQTEKNNIIQIGQLNGYNETFTKNIIEKHERRKYHNSYSKMFTSSNSEPERIFSRTFSLPFHPNLTKSHSKVFATYEIRLIESSSNYKIKNQFETTRTKIPEFERSGIYQISCKTQRCGYKYIRQSRRQIQTRFIEHLRAFKNKKQEKSAVALHMLTKDCANRNYLHNFDHTSLELVKSVTNTSKLDALESIIIQRDMSGKLMNLDRGFLESELFTML